MNGEASHQQHRRDAAREVGSVRLAIVTVSDTRTADSDRSGTFLRESAERSGHEVVTYEIVPDEPERIGELLSRLIPGPAQVILLNGGTGISRRDRTFDVVASRIETPLPGFGEIFRMLSYRQVGSAAILSRATAGLAEGKVLISLPGSPAAVELAWNELIDPEIRHLVREAGR